ncbi:hypothetical protein ACL9RF_07630 [Sphingobacterium sp. Mn56C]|uniref:hypothetical protein n=1 Tax=Sphingobacterium sp. Mn56C TaxID=3395261 RepID=UPI003BD38941
MERYSIHNTQHDDANEQPTTPNSHPEQDVPPGAVGATEPQQPQPKQSKKGLWWAIGICAALLIGGGSWYFVQEKDYTATADSSAADKAKWLPIDEYQKLDENYQQAIIHYLNENNHGDKGYYFLTRIPERAKNIYCFGNFVNSTDSIGDNIAIVAEYFDFKTSSLVIMDANGNLLFTQNFDGLPLIQSFKKGTKIYKEEPTLQRSNVDGILVKYDDMKYAIVFDTKNKKFQQYYQYSDEEIKNLNTPYEEGEGVEAFDPATATPTDTLKNTAP